MTAHAQPANLHKGTLDFVNVDSSPWLSEIVRYRRRKEILDRLQHSFGRTAIQKNFVPYRVT